MKYFKCYSSNLAGYLRQNGFKILGTEVNLKHPQYDVFLFEDTEFLRRVVKAYCVRYQEQW